MGCWRVSLGLGVRLQILRCEAQYLLVQYLQGKKVEIHALSVLHTWGVANTIRGSTLPPPVAW